MAVCSAARGGGEVGEGDMAVVRYLVEEMGCDVNGMDVPEGERFGNHYGTPINYVAHGSGDGRGGEEMVVRYLLAVSFFFFFFDLYDHRTRGLGRSDEVLEECCFAETRS